MTEEEIIQIENAINNNIYDWKKFDKLHCDVQDKLSKRFAERKLDKLLPEFENEPRDWRSAYPTPYIGGLRGEEQFFISYLTVGRKDGAVHITMSSEFTETFRTRAKLDSFIDALTQARDSAFPDGGMEC